MTEIARNMEIVRSIEEAWDGNDLDALDRCFAPGFRSHAALPGLPPGLPGAKIAHRTSMDSFPDRQVSIEGLYGDGSLVCIRTRTTGTNHGGVPWLGVPPNGRRIDFTSISIYRLEEGAVVEHWGQNDVGLLMAQLGAAPAGGPGEGADQSPL